MSQIIWDSSANYIFIMRPMILKLGLRVYYFIQKGLDPRAQSLKTKQFVSNYFVISFCVELKKASKRMTCHKRYKIQKKVSLVLRRAIPKIAILVSVSLGLHKVV